MYPEKLVYENKSYRTTRINEAARVICNPDGLLEGLKKGQASEIGSLSEQVTRIGLEPFSGIFQHLIFSVTFDFN